MSVRNNLILKAKERLKKKKQVLLAKGHEKGYKVRLSNGDIQFEFHYLKETPIMPTGTMWIAFNVVNQEWECVLISLARLLSYYTIGPLL